MQNDEEFNAPQKRNEINDKYRYMRYEGRGGIIKMKYVTAASEITFKTKIKKMKKEYELQGMSCGGCVSNVKRTLLQVPDVTEAEVHLNPQGVVITMNKSVGIEVLQAELNKSGHYTIKEVLNK